MKKGSVLRFALSIYGKCIVAGLLALILNFTLLAAFESNILNIFVLLLGFILQCVLVYTKAWEQGYSDINRDKYEEKKTDIYKGLKAGLIASIPVIIISIVLLLVKTGTVDDAFISYYALLNPSYLPLILSYLPRTLTSAELPVINFIVPALTFIVIPITSAAAYYLGYMDFSVSKKILYINKK